jgi:predicted NodU family carbamoyl transferase
MGLAPYGKPKYVQAIYDHLIDVKEDGTFRLKMDYFNYCTGLTMTNGKFDELFGGPARKPETLLTRDMDLALDSGSHRGDHAPARPKPPPRAARKIFAWRAAWL